MIELNIDMKEIIEKAWNDRSILNNQETISAIKTVIEELDKGLRRVAEPTPNGWVVNEWIKKAGILYFPLQKMKVMEVGPFEYHDKMELKRGYEKLGVRVVPPAAARYGAYIRKGV